MKAEVHLEGMLCPELKRTYHSSLASKEGKSFPGGKEFCQEVCVMLFAITYHHPWMWKPIALTFKSAF